MRCGAWKILQFGGGPKLHAALRACPVLSGLDQSGPDAFPAHIRFDVPPLNKCDTIRDTTLSICPDRQFNETDGFSTLMECDKNFEGFAQLASEIAIDLSGMALGVTLNSVSSSNDAIGIRLNNTTGSFTSNGGTISNQTTAGLKATTATNVSLSNMTFTNAATTNGDTAANCTNIATGSNLTCNAAIYLSGVTGASFTNVTVDGSVQIGINGNNVSGFSLVNSEVRNAGNEAGESGVLFQNLNGTATLTNANIHNNRANQMYVEKLTGSLTLNADPAYPYRAVFGIYSASKTALNAITLALAMELESTRIKVNAACPGFTATDLNNFRGTRTVEQGAREAVRLALLDATGPTGTFSDEDGRVPW